MTSGAEQQDELKRLRALDRPLLPEEFEKVFASIHARWKPAIFAMDRQTAARQENLDIEGVLPFPTDVPTAPLPRISLEKLLSISTKTSSLFKNEESVKMFETCKSLGFFYLNILDADVGAALDSDADLLFILMNGLFSAYSNDEKQEYDLMAKGLETYFGYKGIGASFVDSVRGIKDRNEFWNISQDDLLGHAEQLPAPEILKKTRWLQRSFIRNAHSIATTILTHFNMHLNLPEDKLESLHRLDDPSDSQIRMLHAPPQSESDRGTALGAHTDFGSITILLNKLGGLQVRVPGSDEWLYVRPLRGHVIVNVGDALVKFSNGLLHSNSHRVVSPPGEQTKEDRFSLMYFLRPENDVVLRSLGGEEGNGIIPAKGDEIEEEMSSKELIQRTIEGRGRGGVPNVEGGGKMYWEK